MLGSFEINESRKIKPFDPFSSIVCSIRLINYMWPFARIEQTDDQNNHKIIVKQSKRFRILKLIIATGLKN